MRGPEKYVPTVHKFCDVAALWNIDAARTKDVVDAACDVLAAGVDGPAMRTLAALSVSPLLSPFQVDGPLADALEEVGASLPPRQTDAAAEAAVRAMARRTLRGEMTPRELVSWAHRVITHTGVAVAERLVTLDDQYDLAQDRIYGKVAQVEAEILQEAQRLASGS
jgi:hypothetical protein